ncbi:MAG: S1C family serine protease [Oscillospiraceae bacterium]|nr:S1C family serine protease [Oscillospiraceae bacterium]
MTHDYESKNDQVPESGYIPPIDAPDIVQDVAYTEIPESISSPTPTQEATAQQQSVPEWSLRRRGEPRIENREPLYTEPSYCAPQDTMANMYTPGINTNLGYNNGRYNGQTRRHTFEGQPEPLQQKQRSKAGGFFRALCLVVVCALVSAAATYGVMEYRIRAGYHTVVNQVVLGGTAGSQDGMPMMRAVSSTAGMAAEDIYDMALTQVVGIQTEVPSMGVFGNMSTNTVAGTGFIISADGYILTNYHVIEPAQLNNLPIIVVMVDGTEYEAEVIGYEQSNDVALIKIEASGLTPAVLGDSDNVRVGQTIFAIGNPFGNLVYTMTDGIVSALDRDVTVEGKVINTFQFSAAVNRGNSGGPIYDTNGEVIGIVTAKLSRGDVEGIGFAIPINDAIEIASGLIEHGYIAGRPLIGITGQTVTRGHAEYYGWVVGAYVREVNPGSAAAYAGLEVGDIITGLGESQVTSMDTLRAAMRRYRAGDTTAVQIWRAGQNIEMMLTFDEDLAAGQPGRATRLPTTQREPDIEQREAEIERFPFPIFPW